MTENMTERERALLSYRISTSVNQLLMSLPPEEFEPTLTAVKFDMESNLSGEIALFYADDFMDTNKSETIFQIRPRTQKILDALDIKYRVVNPKTGKEVKRGREKE